MKYEIFSKNEINFFTSKQKKMIETVLLIQKTKLSNRKRQLDQHSLWWRVPKPIMHGIIRESLPLHFGISYGNHHSVYFESGRAWACGKNNHGQLGLGHKDDCFTPTEIIIPGEHIVKAKCGNAHTLFLTASGKVFASGKNRFAQLGLGDNKNRLIPVEIKILDEFIIDVNCANHSLFLTASGKYHSNMCRERSFFFYHE